MATMTQVEARTQVEVSTAVSLNDICKEYGNNGNKTTVLRNVNLDIPEGDFVALMGPSGSGKTTLLNLIAGIDRPTSGTIVTAGTDVGKLSQGQLAKWRGDHIGFIFQFYNLIPVLTAQRNVELPLLLKNLSAKERSQRAA